MKKLFSKLSLIVLLSFFVFSCKEQTSINPSVGESVTSTIQSNFIAAFPNAAASATSAWNMKNWQCKPYAKSLETFLKATHTGTTQTNKQFYGIQSYKVYLLTAKNGNQYIHHDDWQAKAKGTAAEISPNISENGVHVISVIDGYVFDNIHPTGKTQATWNTGLFCPSGGYPSGFTTVDVTGNIPN